MSHLEKLANAALAVPAWQLDKAVNAYYLYASERDRLLKGSPDSRKEARRVSKVFEATKAGR